ncbi:MAG: 50S ribosomal protein L1 [Thermoplasmata archaeon]|nr:50S ribosomal protein L1 [Thermoplasmata archaeon]MCI4355933.1 50S ribosomal protein L1 [Thermoplasmata archaeon]
MADRSSIDVVTETLQKAKERAFPETVEVSINLKDLDLSVPKNRLEDEVPLPNGRGRNVRVALFGTPEMCQKAKDVADVVMAPAQLDELMKDKAAAKKLVEEIDFFLAEAPLMPTIGKRLGVVLGPRGKMPRPVPPGGDPTNIINALKRSVRVRSKGNRTFHAPVGTRTMPPEQIAQNVDALLSRIVGKLERGRNNIESVYVKTSMGPAVRLW